MLNIAHRGGAGLAPENTLACFSLGIKFADMIEFDIQPSKDGQIMVFHDRNHIERTTNGHGRVPELPFDYLRSLDAGSWFDSRYHNERIPTFSEVLSLIPSSIQLNIELKYYDRFSNWFETEVVKTIHDHKKGHCTVIAARHVETLNRINSLDSSLDCALLQKERYKDTYFTLLLAYNIPTAQIRRSALDSSFIQQCHDHGIRVFYFYADDATHMRESIDLGIDGLLTNYPDCLRSVLKK